MDTQHHAPDAEAMTQACQDAFRHLLRRPTDPEIAISVDPVPHFVPGMGASGEWYRVGALHLVATDRYLTVYLDAVTGQVTVEQTMMEVVGGQRTMSPAAMLQRRADSPEREQWENEGGYTGR